MNSIQLDKYSYMKQKCLFIYKKHGPNMTNQERREMADLYMYFDNEYKLCQNSSYNCSEDTDVPDWCKNPTNFYSNL